MRLIQLLRQGHLIGKPLSKIIFKSFIRISLDTRIYKSFFILIDALVILGPKLGESIAIYDCCTTVQEVSE